MNKTIINRAYYSSATRIPKLTSNAYTYGFINKSVKQYNLSKVNIRKSTSSTFILTGWEHHYNLMNNVSVTHNNTDKNDETQENDSDKQYIIDLFNTKVKGKEICVESQNSRHCGKEGHWLEKQMGIAHNDINEPDIRGYEMKSFGMHTKTGKKTTLGDFGATEYAFSGNDKRTYINTRNNWTDDEMKMTRGEFIRYFGNPNQNKNNRYSWSGTCVPKYNTWSNNGQNLVVENNDIIIYYSYSKDTRSTKTNLPEYLKNDDIVIAVWKKCKMEQHINKKFNKKGFFVCKKSGSTFDSICFGRPFDFVYFIECIKNKKIIFDSGMYDGNKRNYSQFRGDLSFWDNLIMEEY